MRMYSVKNVTTTFVTIVTPLLPIVPNVLVEELQFLIAHVTTELLMN